MNKAESASLGVSLTTAGMEICLLFLGLSLFREKLGIGNPAFLLIISSYPLLFFIALFVKRNPGIQKGGNIVAFCAVAAISGVAAMAVLQALQNSSAAQNGFLLPILIQIGFSGLCSFLGARAIRDGSDFQEACNRFQIGIIILLIISAVEVQDGTLIFLFFLLTTLNLALARWAGSLGDVTGVLRGRRPQHLWLGSVCILLLSTIVVLLSSPDLARSIVYLLQWIGSALAPYFDYHPPPQGAATTQINIGPRGCSIKPPAEEFFSHPPLVSNSTTEASPLFLWIMIFLLFVGVLLFVSLAVRKIRARRAGRHPSGVLFETIPIADGAKLKISQVFMKLLKGLRRLLLGFSGYLKRREHRDFQEGSCSPITLYLRLLQWGARQGLPRISSQTPLEYLAPLCRRFPENARELNLITNTFMEARYNRMNLKEEMIGAAVEAWQEIVNKPKALRYHAPKGKTTKRTPSS